VTNLAHRAPVVADEDAATVLTVHSARALLVAKPVTIGTALARAFCLACLGLEICAIVTLTPIVISRHTAIRITTDKHPLVFVIEVVMVEIVVFIPLGIIEVIAHGCFSDLPTGRRLQPQRRLKYPFVVLKTCPQLGH
jgi:hypothetical protein